MREEKIKEVLKDIMFSDETSKSICKKHGVSYSHFKGCCDALMHRIGISKELYYPNKYGHYPNPDLACLKDNRSRVCELLSIDMQNKSKWQPIETAPRDGTPILGYADGKMATVKWNDYDFWDLFVCGSWAEDGEWNPTHWMPLPDPPNA